MAVVDAVVTILTRLHDPVAAVRTQLAIRAALAVCACVDAVVTLFPEHYDSIAALGVHSLEAGLKPLRVSL